MIGKEVSWLKEENEIFLWKINLKQLMWWPFKTEVALRNTRASLMIPNLELVWSHIYD